MTLTETDRKWLAWLIVVVLTVVGTIIGVQFPQLPPIPAASEIGAQGVTNLTGLEIVAPTTMPTATPAAVFDSLGLSNILEVRDAATPVWAVNNGGNVVHTGDTTQTGDIALSGALDIAGLLLTSFTNLTVTEGYIITPTVTTYALDTAGAVTITLGASADEGQILILINDDANAVIVDDTNIRTSTGAALTMAGAYDVLVFIYQDAEWVELLAIADS